MKNHDEGEGSLREKQNECEECDFVTERKGALKSHLLTKHKIIEDGSNIFHCYQCDYAAIRQSTLKIHMSTKHSSFKEFTCDECDFATFTNYKLKRHIISKHTNIRFLCENCDYQAAELGTLNRHRAQHQSGSLKCNLCKYTTRLQANLSRHVKKTTRTNISHVTIVDQILLY